MYTIYNFNKSLKSSLLVFVFLGWPSLLLVSVFHLCNCTGDVLVNERIPCLICLPRPYKYFLEKCFLNRIRLVKQNTICCSVGHKILNETTS